MSETIQAYLENRGGRPGEFADKFLAELRVQKKVEIQYLLTLPDIGDYHFNADVISLEIEKLVKDGHVRRIVVWPKPPKEFRAFEDMHDYHEIITLHEYEKEILEEFTKQGYAISHEPKKENEPWTLIKY